ncbi:MAG: hypothetical protein ACRYE7_01875 [Janthinobacterium lividum]
MADPRQQPQGRKAPTPPIRESHPTDGPLILAPLSIKLGPSISTELEYDSYDDCYQAFQAHCAPHGYSIRKRVMNQGKNGATVYYVCDREGLYRDRKNPDLHPSKRRKNVGSRKCGCQFTIIAAELPSKQWKISYKNEEHNHEASDGRVNHPAHRTKTLSLNQSASEIVSGLISRMTKVSIIRATLKNDWGIELTKRDIYNMKGRMRIEQLGGLTPIQWLERELEERNFFVKIDTDKDNRAMRIFFAHPESIKIWRNVCDVLLIDATYKTNRFHQPLVNICGSLGNNMTPQLGLAFVSGEKEEDYRWVLGCTKELLLKADIPFPRCFVTDRELALMSAIEGIFAESDHILCRWHINMNVVAKTKKFFTILEDWLEFFEAWLAVLDAITEEEYEKNVTEFKKHNKDAVKYCVGTWLFWKEKVVSTSS